MKTLLKKHGWYPILVFIPVVLFGFILFAHALTINGIDTAIPFSAKDTSSIAATLKADTEEKVVLTKVLADQKPDYTEIESFVSLLRKSLTNLAPKEIQQIMHGDFTANSWIKYKSRNVLLTNQTPVL